VKWTEVFIETTSAGIEPITGLLISAGIIGMQIDNPQEMQEFILNNPDRWDYVDEGLMEQQPPGVKIIFYVSDTPHGADTIANIREGLKRLRQFPLDVGSLELTVTNVDDKDWKDKWRQYYKPFLVGERLAVKPVWERFEAPQGRVSLELEPGHVFGTGLHQSTRLCMELMEKYIERSDHVLDLGCGSGILSIASILLGAEKALAVDLEPDAKDIARHNAELNNIDAKDYEIIIGNVLVDEAVRSRIEKEKYPVIMANIVADVIIDLSELVPSWLKKGGVFISSGIISQREHDVISCFKEKGFILADRLCQDDWVCLAFKE